MSKAYDISMAFSARLVAISTDNGYQTNIGEHVFRGRLSINVEDLPCTVIVEDPDSDEDVRGVEVLITRRYTFEGHDKCDPKQPNDKAHAILADIKRAIFNGDQTYGGLFRPHKGPQYKGSGIGTREDGTAICAASVSIEVSYVENLMNP